MGKTYNGSSRNCDKEFSREQKLAHENKKLKREISKLRKQIARLDLESDRFKNLKELVDQQYREDNTKKESEKAKTKWQCFKCQEGVLKIVIYTRRDGTHYFRKCNLCENRTTSKVYTNEVENS